MSATSISLTPEGFTYDDLIELTGLPPVWLTLGVGGSQAASAAV